MKKYYITVHTYVDDDSYSRILHDEHKLSSLLRGDREVETHSVEIPEDLVKQIQLESLMANRDALDAVGGP